MRAAGDEAGKMRHIDHQPGADLVSYAAEAGKVDLARHGGAPGDDQLGLVFDRQRLDLIIVDQVVLLAHAVLDGVEPLARLIGGSAMGQVAA